MRGSLGGRRHPQAHRDLAIVPTSRRRGSHGMDIFVVGDSISIQYGPYLRQALDGVMGYARKDGEQVALLNLDIPMGANGGDSRMVRDFLAALAAAGELRADLVLVNCGLHDIKRDPATGRIQVALDAYRDNLRAIVGIVAGTRARLVWVRSTPVDDAVHNRPGVAFHRFAADLDAYNAAADAVMAAAGVPSIDLHGCTRRMGADVYCDHVHFTEPVRARQAAFIAGWLAGWTAPHSAALRSG
jgi:lysophospholipase L1-like esterase